MSDSKYKVIQSARVRKFVVDPTYSSKMLFDDELAGKKTIQINEGTVSPGCALGGGTHGEDEIYYILKGQGTLALNDDVVSIQSGSLVYIPAGTFHALTNTDPGEPLVLLTLWREPSQNDVYARRIKEWGASFMLEDDTSR